MAFSLIFILSSCHETAEELNLSESSEQVNLMGQQEFVPGKYIVVLNESTISFRRTEDYESVQAGMRMYANEFTSGFGVENAKVDRVYGNLFSGFTVELNPEQLRAVESDPRVKYVEQDGYMYATQTQSNATWGLDRIDQVSLPLDKSYTYNSTGTGVTAYIIDTGILTSHNEFGGRAQRGFDAFGGTSEDCNGHGTHVAGTVGGEVYGVAKNVNLVAVRVLNCSGSGTFSGVIAGMDWVASNASGPSVANMSLGGGASTSVNDAVNRMYNAGVPVMVAAGNSNANACNYSPSSAPNAYTVGSSTSNDSRSSFSNYGSCVDIFAPGSSITAAWYTSNTSTNTISGTSMASPHVAGVAALYLETNPSASAQQVYDFISANSSKSKVTNSLTTNNHLVYSLGTDGGDGGDGGGGEDPSGITLSGQGSKVQGRWRATLSWAGAASSQVDIYRDGTKIATVNNSGSYTDQTSFRGGGSLTYKVCEAGSSTCSSEITVQF